MLDKLLKIQFHWIASFITTIIAMIVNSTNLPIYIDWILIIIQLIFLIIVFWMLYKLNKKINK